MTLTEKLRERISRAFYNHGLLCASYPIPIILFTGLCILACCYPLLKLPLPGTGPVEYSTPVKDYSPPSPDAALQQGDLGERPDWYVGAPVAYIQQIFVKATVSPWQKNFLAVDVFRSPLSRVFQLVEEIRNHALRDSLHADGTFAFVQLLKSQPEPSRKTKSPQSKNGHGQGEGLLF